MNDIIVQFAILWGQTIGSAITPKEIEIAKDMKHYDSEELFHIFSKWAEEYISSNEEDTVAFFERQLNVITLSFTEYMNN